MEEHWEIRRTGGTATEERLGLAERLLATRRWRELTQWTAAREIGVSRKTISRIETGYVAHPNTRALVRRWLEEQEAAKAEEEARAEAAERAAASRPVGIAGRPAPRRRLRSGRVTVALEARRVVQRKRTRACRRARVGRRR